jgi:ubiquitin-activating enzyme E1
MADLATQYYLDEGSLGQPRAKVSYDQLKELNPLVQLHLLEPASMDVDAVAEAVEASGQKFDVVVAADQDKSSEEALNGLARRLNAKFVAAQAPGLFGSVFCDFGDEFTVNDTDGREAKTGLLKGFEALPLTGETLVTLLEGERHDLSKGDAVVFEPAAAVEGEDGGGAAAKRTAPDLSGDSYPVKRIVNPSSFTIPASPSLLSHASQYTGGRFRQLKQPLQLAFQPLGRARREMQSMPTDFGKASLGRQLTLHACFESLGRFKAQKKGRMPTPGSAADAAAFKKLVKTCDVLKEVIQTHTAAAAAKIAARKPSSSSTTTTTTKKKPLPKPPVLDEKVMEVFARTCQGSLAPICSFVGGTAAQEVLKACTGTFVPLQQYLFFDAVEVLVPEEEEEEEEGERGERGEEAVLGGLAVGRGVCGEGG